MPTPYKADSDGDRWLHENWSTRRTVNCTSRMQLRYTETVDSLKLVLLCSVSLNLVHFTVSLPILNWASFFSHRIQCPLGAEK